MFRLKTKDRILNFIIAFVEENGYSPTIREIGEGVGLRSTSTVHGHLKRLQEEGLTLSEQGKPRTSRAKGFRVVERKGLMATKLEFDGRIYKLEE